MIGIQRVEVDGRRFVFLPEVEYERLCHGAGETVAMADEELPALPEPDKHGRFPALQYARISLARDVIRHRKGAGPEPTAIGRPGGRPAGNPVEDRNREADRQRANGG